MKFWGVNRCKRKVLGTQVDLGTELESFGAQFGGGEGNILGQLKGMETIRGRGQGDSHCWAYFFNLLLYFKNKVAIESPNSWNFFCWETVSQFFSLVFFLWVIMTFTFSLYKNLANELKWLTSSFPKLQILRFDLI